MHEIELFFHLTPLIIYTQQIITNYLYIHSVISTEVSSKSVLVNHYIMQFVHLTDGQELKEELKILNNVSIDIDINDCLKNEVTLRLE